MAVQAGLCLAWSETHEDMFCHVVAHIICIIIILRKTVALYQGNSLNFNIEKPGLSTSVNNEIADKAVKLWLYPRFQLTANKSIYH